MAIVLVVIYQIGIFKAISYAQKIEKANRELWLPRDEAYKKFQTLKIKKDSLTKVINDGLENNKYYLCDYFHLIHLTNDSMLDHSLGNIRRDIHLEAEIPFEIRQSFTEAIRKGKINQDDLEKTIESYHADEDPIDKAVFLRKAKLWLLKTYLLFTLLFIISCLNRLWRNPENTVALYPRNIISFLLRLPFWPIFWYRFLHREITYHQYNQKEINLLSKEDKAILDKVRRFGSTTTLNITLTNLGIKKNKSYIAALLLLLLLQSGFSHHIPETTQFHQEIIDQNLDHPPDLYKWINAPPISLPLWIETILEPNKQKPLTAILLETKWIKGTKSPPPKYEIYF